MGKRKRKVDVGQPVTPDWVKGVIPIDRARIMPFRKRECQCRLCKVDRCGGDITHIGIAYGHKLYLCWVCAREMASYGVEVWEIQF